MERPLFMIPRRRRSGWSMSPDRHGRVRMMLSLSPEDAARLDRAAGRWSPTSWATAKVLEAVETVEKG